MNRDEFSRAMNDADTASPIAPAQVAELADPRAEHAVCAALLHLQGAALEVDGVTRPEDFSARARGEFVRAAIGLHRAGDAINEHTIASALRLRRVYDALGGDAWLATFREPVPEIDTVRTLARNVAELAHARKVVETARLIVSDGLSGVEDPRGFVERSAERLARAAESKASARVVLIEDVVDRRRKTWKRYRDEGLEPGGIPSGFPRLDAITRGLRLKTVQFAGALTGRGKSVYANMIANAVAGASYNGETAGVVYVSGEMDEDQLHDRGVCAEAGVSERDLERVMCNGPDKQGDPALDPMQRGAIWDAIEGAQAKLSRLPIAYYAQVAGISDIRGALRDATRQWRERAPDPKRAPRPMLLVVDYVQMMRVRGSADSRTVALGEFVYELKDIANRGNLCVLALAQMNKAILTSGAGAAKAEDMKDASALAESASTVVYIHRPAYEMPKGSEKRKLWWPYSEFQIVKGRGHQLGEVPMLFEGRYYRFREPSDEELVEITGEEQDDNKARAPKRDQQWTT